MPSTTLRSVVDQLGALVLRHTAEGPGGDRAVTGVVIDDRDLGAPLAPGTAVLGIGVGTDARLGELLARAAAAGAAAVFVKHRRGEPLSAPADRDGPVVVEVAPDLGWEQLHVFLRTALLHVGEARPGGPQTLFDVANAIALLVDGATVIEDEHLRVIAYSSLDHEIDDARRATILGRVIPDQYVTEIRAAGITAHLEGSADPVRFDLAEPGMLPRLVIALRSGGRTIGLLWAITDDEREANARRVLSDAAPDVAVELLRSLTADASRATDRLSAARRLLDGGAVPGLRELLGAEPTAGFVAVVLEPAPDAPTDPDPVARAAQFATVYVDAYHVPALVASVSGPQVELVVGLTDTTPAARARDLVDQLCARTEATFGIRLRGAVGTVAADGRGIPASRRDALAALAVAEERTVRYEDVHVRVALQELLAHAAGSEHLSRGPVLALAASGAKADAAIVATVRAYLAAGGDVTSAAAHLGVHRNTVRYRLDRFEQLTATDLADPAARLVTQVQLELSASNRRFATER